MRLRLGTGALILIATPLLLRCKKAAPNKASAPSSSALLVEAPSEPAPSAGPAQQRHGAATKAGERVSIPAGKLDAGSTPGDAGRDPTLEPPSYELDLGAFAMDALPYPNDPQKPPLTGMPRARAASQCAAAGGRLCTELEWERACKGPDQQLFSGNSGWDPGCANRGPQEPLGANWGGKNPEGCASGFGVLAMGGAMREWTASDVAPIKGLRPNAAAAVRGAAADAADVDHRCAHRLAVDADSGAPDLGFRCCYGPPDAHVIASPSVLATAQKIDLPAERLAALLASNPKLAPFSQEVKYFREHEAVPTVLRRGQACSDALRVKPNNADSGNPTAAEQLTTSPLLWNPVPGEEIVVVTGQSGGNRSFILAFYRLPGDRYRVAAAMLLDGEPGPIAIMFNMNVRKKLEWAVAWRCLGESGTIAYRDERRVVITQQ